MFKKGSTGLKSHRARFHMELKFRCPEIGCEKLYTNQHNLDTHLKIHRGEKDFICTYPGGCGKSYFRAFRLNQHYRLTHENFKMGCPVEGCKFSVGRNDYMRNHVKAHRELSLEELENYLKVVKSMKLV